jgi:hypothetical protein
MIVLALLLLSKPVSAVLWGPQGTSQVRCSYSHFLSIDKPVHVYNTAKNRVIDGNNSRGLLSLAVLCKVPKISYLKHDVRCQCVRPPVGLALQ